MQIKKLITTLLLITFTYQNLLLANCCNFKFDTPKHLIYPGIALGITSFNLITSLGNVIVHAGKSDPDFNCEKFDCYKNFNMTEDFVRCQEQEQACFKQKETTDNPNTVTAINGISWGLNIIEGIFYFYALKKPAAGTDLNQQSTSSNRGYQIAYKILGTSFAALSGLVMTGGNGVLYFLNTQNIAPAWVLSGFISGTTNLVLTAVTGVGFKFRWL